MLRYRSLKFFRSLCRPKKAEPQGAIAGGRGPGVLDREVGSFRVGSVATNIHAALVSVKLNFGKSGTRLFALLRLGDNDSLGSIAMKSFALVGLILINPGCPTFAGQHN